MRHNPEHLRRAREILSLLNAENISSDEYNPMLKIARDFREKMSDGMPGQVLTSRVATTLCGVGLCEELTQRFALEYCLKYGEQNVGLVFLNNTGKGNHVLAYVGTPSIPDDVFIGRGAGSSQAPLSKNKNYFLQDFITENPGIIFVDPLLKFANGSDQLQPLIEYCREHEITHVAGVRDYANTSGLVENAALIKSNAERIAGRIKREAANPAVAAVMTAVGAFRSQSVSAPQTRNSNLFSSGVPGAFGCEPPPGSYIDEHKKTVIPSAGH